jgi:hypothetical protein
MPARFLQYPDIVSLQAIVGQSAGQAPSQADQAAAAAALSVAANPAVNGASETTPSAASSTGQGTSVSYNPMAWLSPAPAPAVGDATAHSGVAVKEEYGV